VALPSAAPFAFLAADRCQESRAYRLRFGLSIFRELCRLSMGN